MADFRETSFEIDPGTWVLTPPPAALINASAAGQVTFDLDAALMFVGILTRPPELHGFSLSDSWAWLRYFPAFAVGNRVKLRPEWTSLDTHQKTVASDDFGIGLGTWVLRDLLGFRRYADTLHVVNVLERGQWRLRRHAKRGPTKSPDYIAYDQTGAISVVECKGTQTSRAELLKALGRGAPQKRALRALQGQQIIHQLVVGTYVPQHQSRSDAVIAVHDPEKDDSRQELQKYTEDEIIQSTEQVSIAKELAMFELPYTAATLVHDRYSPESVGTAYQRDTARVREEGRMVANETLTIQREYRWVSALERRDHSFRGVKFKASVPLDRIERFRRVRGQRDLPDAVVSDVAEEEWSGSSTDVGTRIHSPLGATYEVEWLE